MHLNTHLVFNGQCEAAFNFYEQCLGGKITFMLTYAAAPAPLADAALADKINHATLKVGDQTLTGIDLLPEAYERPQGFTLQMNLDDAADAQRIYAALAEDARILMPLQKTFWADHFAVLTDRFGVPWEINCTQKAKEEN